VNNKEVDDHPKRRIRIKEKSEDVTKRYFIKFDLLHFVIFALLMVVLDI